MFRPARHAKSDLPTISQAHHKLLLLLLPGPPTPVLPPVHAAADISSVVHQPQHHARAEKDVIYEHDVVR
jgi:hypothetical protein